MPVTIRISMPPVRELERRLRRSPGRKVRVAVEAVMVTVLVSWGWAIRRILGSGCGL
jgi:hypothetical protein